MRKWRMFIGVVTVALAGTCSVDQSFLIQDLDAFGKRSAMFADPTDDPPIPPPEDTPDGSEGTT